MTEFTNGPTTQVFGANKHFAWQLGYGHLGKDWGVVIGTNAVAIAPGVVLWADWGHLMPKHLADLFSMIWKSPNSGICVVIQHDGWYSLYAHLDSTHLYHKSAFHKASVVKDLQVVGKTGNTGNSTGPHLHGEVFRTDGAYPGTFGRYNPDWQIAEEDKRRRNAGTIAHQSNDITVEGELTVSQIKTIEAQLKAIRTDQSNIKSVLASPSGFTWNGKHYPSVWHVVAQNQRDIRSNPGKVWAFPILNRLLGRNEAAETFLGSAEDRIIRQNVAPLSKAVAELQGTQAGLLAAVQAIAEGKNLGDVERIVFEAAKAGGRAGAHLGTADTLKGLKTETTLVIEDHTEEKVA